MATAQLSGYLSSAIAASWTSGQALDSLTDDEWTDLTDEIDNSTNKYLFADLEINLTSVAFSGNNSGIEIYLVPSVDGTSYPNWTGNVTTDEQENQQHFVGFVSTSGATESQTLVLRGLALPPGKYKYGFRNRGGVTLGVNNSVQWRPWGYESV